MIFAFALLLSLTIGESIFGTVLAQWTLDNFSKWDVPIDEDQIVLIDITEDDYEKIFARKRPLDPAKIVQLISAAHRAGAKLIAVDISTADWPKESTDQIANLPREAARVWARGFYLDQQTGHAEMRLEALLGDLPASKEECYGVSALGRQSGITRYFYSGINIGGGQPSFVNQVINRSRNRFCLQSGNQDEELRIINFSSQIRRESASTLLQASNQADWGRRPEYADKIVLLGGTFHSGADMQLTPIGARSGFEVVGHALSSAMRNKARGQLAKPYCISIDIVIGIILFAVGFWQRWLQLALTIIFIPVLGYFGLYLFRQYYLFISFVPFIVGVLAHMYLGWTYDKKEAEHPLAANPASSQTSGAPPVPTSPPTTTKTNEYP